MWKSTETLNCVIDSWLFSDTVFTATIDTSVNNESVDGMA
jgi:hypothetical protein